MKKKQASLVLETLLPFLEAPETDDEKAPVRRAYRYLRNRMDQVDYQGATEKGLSQSAPVKLKELTAMSFKLGLSVQRSPNNIDYMLVALRLCRINQRWDNYWQSVRQQVA